MRRSRALFCCAATGFALAGAAWHAPVAAQGVADDGSRAVVQPLPPAGVADLEVALSRLARNSQDVDALISAGNASLQLNDVAAAIGFFGRADELSPGNARVKVGLAGAFVRSERPIEALRLFDEAERAGASTSRLSGDRGLAYDLVGDPVSAQVQYRQALSAGANDELVRRMALSQAIAGNRADFEKTLYPLLVKQDFAAYRTRAFGLAILGEEKEAIAITEAVMPKEMSARMAPYLKYMNRLTKAQQAAAANLGIFPRAAQIGRDDPRIAEYTSASPAVRTADARLAPQGAPLGPRVAATTAAQPAAPGSGKGPVAAPATAVTAAAVAPPPAAASVRPMTSTPVVQSAAVVPAQAPVSEGQTSLAQVVERQQVAPQAAPVEPAIARIDVPPSQSGPEAKPGFNLADVTPASTGQPVQTLPPPPPETKNVADAFANFALETAQSAPATRGAVDITAIKPPREKAVEPAAKPAAKPATKPAAKPEPPKEPRRFWVQVATGRDRKALAFDWRRIKSKAGDVLGKQEAHVTEWGQTSRLLAGPYDTLKAAQVAVAKLKTSGIDSFTFTSPEGQAVSPIS